MGAYPLEKNNSRRANGVRNVSVITGKVYAVASWHEKTLFSAGVVWSGVLRAAMHGFGGCRSLMTVV